MTLFKRIATAGSVLLLSSIIFGCSMAAEPEEGHISDKAFRELMTSMGFPVPEENFGFKTTGDVVLDARRKLIWETVKVHYSGMLSLQKWLPKLQLKEITQQDFQKQMEASKANSRKLFDELWALYDKDDKSGDIAFETLVFLSETDDDNKERAQREVMTTYIHDKRVSGLIHKRASSNFRKSEWRELERVVQLSESPAVKAAAVVTIVEHLNEVRKFLKELDLFGTTIDDAIFSQFSQGLRNMMQYGGENPYGEGKALTREVFDTHPELIKASREHALRDWEGVSVAELSTEIGKLMKQAQPWGDEEVYFANVSENGGVDLSRKVKVSELLAKVQGELDRDPVGKPVEDFVVADYDGNEVSLDSLKGKVLLVDFWATWCGPCVAAMPHNQELLKHFKDRPFELVTVSVDADVEDAASFMEENDYEFRVLWHTSPRSELLRTWNVDSYPTYFVIDDLGVLRAIPQDRGEAMDRFIERVVQEAERRQSSRG